MQVLPLCLAWNALPGIALVRLLEGDLLSPVTIPENNHLEVYVLAGGFYTPKPAALVIYTLCGLWGHSRPQFLLFWIFVFGEKLRS